MEKNLPRRRLAAAVIWLLALPATIMAAIGASELGPAFLVGGWLAFLAAAGLSAWALLFRLPRVGLRSRRMAFFSLALSSAALLAGAAIWDQGLTPVQRAAREARQAASIAAAEADAKEEGAWAATRAHQKAVAAALYPPAPPGPCAEATDGRALVEARAAVRARLKNPGAAKFSPAGETAIKRSGDCAFTIIGWVDATNSFGAVIRSRWGVDLEASGDAWSALAVLIE